MRYMGGKARIAKRLVAAILADTPSRSVWFEPFMGGGNVMEHAAPHFEMSVGCDAHEDLMLMWQHVAVGGAVPEMITREEYQALRHADPSWLRGFAGFAGSFGGKWFGGYGVDSRSGPVVSEGHRSVSRQGRVFAERGVRLLHARFGQTVDPPAGSVVYCDPPYRETTGYAVGSFDHDFFYKTLAIWARTSCVYVSEYATPPVAHREVWSINRSAPLVSSDNTRRVIERLFRILPDA